MNYTITLSEEEEKALLSDMISIQEWIENVIHNKARQVIDRIVFENSDKQPGKMTQEDKLQIIRDVKFETAQERSNRFEAKMNK